jgi:DNA-directed RNA polymerase subunit RPC12/RpoP
MSISFGKRAVNSIIKTVQIVDCPHGGDVKCSYIRKSQHRMSEFKYACPVCGQHMKCDSSQSGSIVECPTCFQKITVPQAPTSDQQKLIITGLKVTEKKYSLPADLGGVIAPIRKSSVTTVVAVICIIVLAAGTGVYLFFGKSFHGKFLSGGRGPVGSSAWRSGDIGDVGAAGSSSEEKGVFTLSGSGADIWHQVDGFYYLFQPLNGNGSLTARVLDINNTHEWAKAGVMIRNSTNAESAFMLASLRADGQAQLIWRRESGVEAEASKLVGGTGYPKWVKIVRSGDRFSAYFKVNAGSDWADLGEPQTIAMSPTAEIGLVVCSHNAGTLCQAQLDEVTLQTDGKSGSSGSAKAPKLVAPPASDTNWTLNLDGLTNFPDMPAAGRIHGRDFICARAILQGGVLTLHSPDNLNLNLNFGGAPPEALAGQTINVTTNAGTAARLTLRWDDAGRHEKENFTNGYALRLELAALNRNRIPGKIYLCAPDDLKSYVMGNINLEVRKPKARKK